MRLICGDEDYIEEFTATLNKCKRDVWLMSPWGDKYNLKSKISYYLALGELLKEHGDMLELFCDDKEDEALFLAFFNKHPNTL